MTIGVGQQGLDLAGKLVVNTGDVIVTDHLEQMLAGHPDAKMTGAFRLADLSGWLRRNRVHG